MATLLVPATSDYSATALLDIDTIRFTNLVTATATFAAAQFDGISIYDDVLIDGNADANNIIVNGSGLDASQWQFQDWGGAGDTLTFSGTAGADTIIGSLERDLIRGKSGRDILKGGQGDDDLQGGRYGDILVGGGGEDELQGGSGNDRFIYRNAGNLVASELVDGGAGDGDRIVAEAIADTVEFRDIVITNIEELAIEGGITANFHGDQIGFTWGLQTVIASAETDSFTIWDSRVNLSTVGFVDWNDDDPNLGGIDYIKIIGTGAADELTGSGENDYIYGHGSADEIEGGDGNDIIFAGAGLDHASGGSGNDYFWYLNPDELEDLESADGGTGTDRIRLLEDSVDATYNLLTSLPVSIEELEIMDDGVDTTLTVEIAAGYIGVAGITSVIAQSTTILDVTGPFIDLSAVNFSGVRTPEVLLTGDDTSNIIIGSALADVIAAGDADDGLVGGEGGDRITGGLGSDDMTGGSDADAFVFETLDDTPTGNTRDRIEDFTPGEDVIEILPALGFTFLGEGAFSATGAAEINYEHSGSNTIVGIDGDGDGLAEAKIALVGTLTLSEADFAIA